MPYTYRHHLTENVVDDNGSLLLGSQPVQVNSLQTPGFSEIFENIPLIVAGSQVKLFTTPLGAKRLYLTKCDFILTAVAGLAIGSLTGSGYPSVNLGWGANRNEVASGFTLQGLNTQFSSLASLVQGVTPSVPPSTDFYLKVATVANASLYKISLRLLGYYY